MISLRRTFACLFLTGAFGAFLAPGLAAQTIIDACYIEKTGVLYMIDPGGTKPGSLPTACANPGKHITFSWVDGAGANHGALTGLSADDHPQYLLISGVRALTGALKAGGNKLTGLAAATASGDAVRIDEAVVDGDAAGGDLGGTFPNPTVIAIQGNAVNAVAPTDGQLLGWDAATSSWKPMNAQMVISDHSNLSGLTGDDHPQYLLANGVRAGSFAVTGSGAIPIEGRGDRMMWYGDKAAFRAGSFLSDEANDVNVGRYSVAMGREATAQGRASIAMGDNSVATGEASISLGSGSVAQGLYSTAIGHNSFALGFVSVGIGDQASSEHDHTFVYSDGSQPFFKSTAKEQFLVLARGGVGIGLNNPLPGGLSVNGIVESRAGGVKFPDGTTQTTATSFNTLTSLSLGCKANAVHGGSFVWAAECATGGTVSSSAGNQFTVMAVGGTRIISDALNFGGVAGSFTGVQLPQGAGAWSTLSARASKRDFRDEDGEATLSKIAGLSIQSWSYKAQDASTRHLGPVAEDFYAAFRLGEDEHRITTTDLDGVNMLAIQALEKRTAVLRQEVAVLQAENDELRQRMARLEALLASMMAPAR